MVYDRSKGNPYEGSETVQNFTINDDRPMVPFEEGELDQLYQPEIIGLQDITFDSVKNIFARIDEIKTADRIIYRGRSFNMPESQAVYNVRRNELNSWLNSEFFSELNSGLNLSRLMLVETGWSWRLIHATRDNPLTMELQEVGIRNRKWPKKNGNEEMYRKNVLKFLKEPPEIYFLYKFEKNIVDTLEFFRRFRLRSLTNELRKSVISNMCDSVSEMHAMGLLHRDIKPTNYWLQIQFDNNVCSSLRLKLGDFEIATPLTEKLMLSVGDFHYAHPDLSMLTTIAEPYLDIYSLALSIGILYYVDRLENEIDTRIDVIRDPSLDTLCRVYEIALKDNVKFAKILKDATGLESSEVGSAVRSLGKIRGKYNDVQEFKRDLLEALDLS